VLQGVSQASTEDLARVPSTASTPDDAPGTASAPDNASLGSNALGDTDWAELAVLADVNASLQTSAQWETFLEPIAATEVFELERN
jgi:hypothetical protein